jgi:hypothetical protein
MLGEAACPALWSASMCRDMLKKHQLLLSTPWTQPAVSCAAPGHLMVHDCPDARMLEDPIQEIYVPVRLC